MRKFFKVVCINECVDIDDYNGNCYINTIYNARSPFDFITFNNYYHIYLGSEYIGIFLKENFSLFNKYRTNRIKEILNG